MSPRPSPAQPRARIGATPWRPGALLACLVLIAPASSQSDLGARGNGISVIDAAGREIRLAEPAARVISLAPHVTELLFAAGAGDRIVATVEFSDHPPPALDIPRIGSATQIDFERVLGHRPDLILAWASGNRRRDLDRLENLGLDVYRSEPADFAAIAEELRRLGKLAGTAAQAEVAARGFEREIDGLRARYSDRPPVAVFYQVWDQPLMTVNDAHPISEAIRLCGGRNVFGAVGTLVPRLDLEAVLAADPEAIVSGGPGEDRADWLGPWRARHGVMATQRGNLFFIPPSLLQRHTPRIAEGTRRLCEALELARTRRPDTP